MDRSGFSDGAVASRCDAHPFCAGRGTPNRSDPHDRQSEAGNTEFRIEQNVKAQILK